MGQALERGDPPQRDRDAAPKTVGRYRASPSERRLLDYSAERGIPRSVFLGRKRTSVTTYHYADDGRLEWSETEHDAEFEDDDLDVALEWKHEQSLLCVCGNPLDEGMDDDMKAAWIAERRICWACAARERTQYGDNHDGKRAAHGTKYLVRNRAYD